MNKKNRKISLINTWTISYTLIMLIPLIAALLISVEYEKNMNQQLINYNNHITQNMSYNFKNAMIDIRKLYYDISLNKHIPSVSAINKPEDYFKSRNFFSLISDMKTYGIYKNDILFYYIYFDKTDHVISETGIIDSKFFYDVYFNKNSSYENWKKTLKKENTGNYHPLNFTENGLTYDAIAINMPVLGLDNATVSILVDKNVVFRNIKSSEQSEHYDTYIFDNHGDLLLYDVKHTDNIPETIKDLPPDSSSTFVMTTNISFDTVNMTFATVTYKKEFLGNITNMRLFSAFWIAFGLIVSLIMIRYCTKLNYQPIKDILKIFGVAEKKDEYNIILNSIERILKENKTLTNDYEKQNVTIKLWFLSRILKGVHEKEYSTEVLAQYGINFEPGEFAVLAIYCHDLNELFKDEADYDFDKKFDVIKFIVTNVFEELMCTKNSIGYVLDIDNILFCVVNTYHSEQPGKEFVRRKADYGTEFIKTHFNVDISFSLSEFHDSPQSLPLAYSEALHTMAYKKIMNISSPLMYEDIKKAPASDYPFTLEEEHTLINYIRTANADSAKALINKMFNDIINTPNIPLEYSVCLVIDIVAAMLKLPNGNEDITNKLLSTIGTGDMLLSYSDLDTLRNQILKTTTELCCSMPTNNKENYYPNKIIEYIKENYSDINLCRSSIAAYFDLTPSYVSKIFKEVYGEPLVDYINKYRLMKAKELIKTGRYTFSEISQMVGYDQIRTFNRIFKKYENITPSEYKSLS